MFISFAWTTTPFLADVKDVTRRYWKDIHAKKFNEGMIVNAYDKLPYRGGNKIGEIKITKKPYQQRTGDMDETDYRREGLFWMAMHGETIHGEKPRKFFDDWKEKDDLVWVVEFEKLQGNE